ncbi:hypothetical protein [Salinirussus salinus]|jgi:hypothetical protein|uniref:hypothetical protein n=1 Tax=Salinirussus salinus TaxID=1198300 RepID=UPI00135B060B|nr:hypothetical protein [Salinirussus salinus]
MTTPSPDLWATFLFFGLPFVAGLLGLRTGGLWCLQAYRRWQGAEPTAGAPGGLSNRDLDPELDGDLGAEATGLRRSVREQAAIGALLLVGSALLVAHSGRWLLRLL